MVRRLSLGAMWVAQATRRAARVKSGATERDARDVARAVSSVRRSGSPAAVSMSGYRRATALSRRPLSGSGILQPCIRRRTFGPTAVSFCISSSELRPEQEDQRAVVVDPEQDGHDGG